MAAPTRISLKHASSFECARGSHHSHQGKSHEGPVGSLRAAQQAQQPPTPNRFCSKRDKPEPASSRVLRIRLSCFPGSNPYPRATRQLLLCTILVQLTWSPGARRDPTTVCEELMQEAESPSFWHLSPSQLSGSHPVQAPKVLTGGTVILVLHRGRHTRPWRAEGCAWPRCPDRSTGDRHHLMPSRLQQSLQNLCYFKFLCHHCKQTGLRESD